MDGEQKPSGPSTDESVAKCVKFFKTLITLTQQKQGKYAPNALETVKTLIEVCFLGVFWVKYLVLELDCRNDIPGTVCGTFGERAPIKDSTATFDFHLQNSARCTHCSTQRTTIDRRN